MYFSGVLRAGFAGSGVRKVWGAGIWVSGVSAHADMVCVAGKETVMEYDAQLLKDIREGRTESLEKMVIEDAEYHRLAQEQNGKWEKLKGMGLSEDVLEAFSEYTELCASQTARYFELMYELGLQDGLHLGKM